MRNSERVEDETQGQRDGEEGDDRCAYHAR